MDQYYSELCYSEIDMNVVLVSHTEVNTVEYLTEIEVSIPAVNICNLTSPTSYSKPNKKHKTTKKMGHTQLTEDDICYEESSVGMETLLAKFL